MRFQKLFCIFILIPFVLTGCGLFGPSPVEEIYNHLEKAVSLENGFEEQQTPLVELEKKEQELYNKILTLGMSEFEEIKSLSVKAIETVDKREERINKEKESIEASKAEFLKIKPIIEKIEEEEVKSHATELYTVMEKRFDAYDKLYKNYKDALALDRKLYEMFQQKDLTLEQLEKQINTINTKYEVVVKANEEFNKLTEEYNDKKKQFYKEADLNVVFE